MSRVPEILDIIYGDLMLPNAPSPVYAYYVFIKTDRGLTYWLTDAQSEADARETFVTGWNDPAYRRYKREYVNKRNLAEADQVLSKLTSEK